MKKIILSTFIMLFSLVLVSPTFASASEKDDQLLEELSQTGEIIYTDDEITVRIFEDNEEISDAIFNYPNNTETTFEDENESNIMPLVSGPGGTSRIIAGDSGRIVYWTVKPATAWPFNFSGTIKLRYHSGFARDASIGGMGVLGQSISGSVTMNQNNGGVAYLTGTAYAINGHQYTVLPGVHTSF